MGVNLSIISHYTQLFYRIYRSLFNICDALQCPILSSTQLYNTLKLLIRNKQKIFLKGKIIFTIQNEAFDFLFECLDI
jgi:hypothetical protein